MVLVYSLSHGHYASSSFRLPNNIMLITYTHPRKTLSMEQAHPIASQILDNVNGKLELKQELMDLEENDKQIVIRSVPLIETTKITVNYPNDKRKIGDMNYPSGKFYINEPCSIVDELWIKFFNSKKSMTNDSIYSLTNTYMQTPSGSVIKEEIQEKDPKIYMKMSDWIEELSTIYKTMYPNKIIYVIHLSCRAIHPDSYTTVDELTRDFENMTFSEKVYGTPDFRPAFHPGVKRSNRFDYMFNIGVEGYERKYIHPSLILTKSPDVKECIDSVRTPDSLSSISSVKSKTSSLSSSDFPSPVNRTIRKTPFTKKANLKHKKMKRKSKKRK